MSLELTVATTNPAKAVKLRSLCDGLDVRFAGVTEAPPNINETGATHLANAIAKAIGWSAAANSVALASDGGLVIPALGDDWESTLTRRSTGDDVPDGERARRLISRMRELEGQRREAYWAEAVAVARNGVLVCAWETDGLVGRIGMEFEPDSDAPEGFWADGLWETLEGKKRWQLTGAERLAGADPWAQLAEPVNSFIARMT